MHHTHPPTHCLPLREYSCTVRHGCVRCDLHLSPCKHKNMLGVCFNECAPTYTLVYLCRHGSAWVLGKMHWCMEAYTRTRCVCVRAQCANVMCVEGHLVTPALPWSLWSAVSVAVVVSRGDWRLAAQHFQPRQPTSEKEIWVAEMEGLLPSYLQSPLPVQRHPRYSIWEPVCVWCLWCGVCVSVGGWWGDCGGVSVHVYVNASAFMRKCRLYIHVCRHVWWVLAYKCMCFHCFIKTHYKLLLVIITLHFDFYLQPIKIISSKSKQTSFSCLACQIPQIKHSFWYKRRT